MRQYITLFTLLFITLIPTVVTAESFDDCEDHPICSCSAAEAIEVSPDIISSIQDCRDVCDDYKLQGFDVTGYTLQCTMEGILTTISQGALDSDQTDGVESTIDPLVPELNVDIPGLTLDEPIVAEGYVEYNAIGLYIEAVYTWLLAAGSLLAVVMLMLGGLQYMLARGKQEAVGKAKTRIRNATVGIVLLFGAYTIAFLVDPNVTAFDSLKIQSIEKIEYDYPNETPLDFPETSSYALSSTPAEGGIGWDDVVMYNQKDWPNTPYGADECLTSSGGSIMSSGCGVTSFAMVASTILGQTIDPPIVASEWKESGSCVDLGIDGYSDRCRACPDTNICGGCNGTFGNAMIQSELAQTLGLQGEPVGADGYSLSSADQTAMMEKLGTGEYLVISSYKTESGGGHFVVIVGLDDDGNLLINNPWGGIMETRDPDTYFSVMKSAYIFSRNQ